MTIPGSPPQPSRGLTLSPSPWGRMRVSTPGVLDASRLYARTPWASGLLSRSDGAAPNQNTLSALTGPMGPLAPEGTATECRSRTQRSHVHVHDLPRKVYRAVWSESRRDDGGHRARGEGQPSVAAFDRAFKAKHRALLEALGQDD